MNKLHITTQQIKIFEAVARHQSYTKAAQELHLSQPAVSIQVRRLEENNDTKLVEVVGKKLFLTAAGEQMFQSCQRVLSEFDALSINLSSVQKNVSGELVIAVVTPAKYFIPYILKAFLTEYPDVTPKITVINRRRILDELKTSQYHLTIMGRVPEELNMEAVPFFKNELVVIAHPDNPLCQSKRVTLKALSKERFLLREKGSGVRNATEERFIEAGVQIKPYMELGSTESMKQAVMAGLGVSVVPKYSIRLEVKYEHLHILNVEKFPLVRSWFIATMKDKLLPTPAQAFIDFIANTNIEALLEKTDTR